MKDIFVIVEKWIDGSPRVVSVAFETEDAAKEFQKHVCFDWAPSSIQKISLQESNHA